MNQSNRNLSRKSENNNVRSNKNLIIFKNGWINSNNNGPSINQHVGNIVKIKTINGGVTPNIEA